MNDLDTQIRIEAESLCKVIRDYLNISSYPAAPSEMDDILSILNRLENLLSEVKVRT